jgi:CRP-like cAMP-binding protein
LLVLVRLTSFLARAVSADSDKRSLVAFSDVGKRIQQVELAFFKAEQKLIGLGAELSKSVDTDRLIAIGQLARAILTEFSSVPKQMLKSSFLLGVPSSGTVSAAAARPARPLPSFTTALDLHQSELPEPVPPMPSDSVDAAPPPLPSDSDVVADDSDEHDLRSSSFSSTSSAFSSFASTTMSFTMSGEAPPPLPLHSSQEFAATGDTAPPSPTRGQSGRQLLTSILLTLTDNLSLPRAQIDALLRTANDPGDAASVRALESVIASAESALAQLKSKNVHRQAREVDKQRRARVTDMNRHLAEGAEVLFGKPWPFDEPDSDDNVVWVTATPAAAAADDAVTPASRKLQQKLSFSSKVKATAAAAAAARDLRVLRAVALHKLLSFVMPLEPHRAVDTATLVPVFVVTFETFAVAPGAPPLDGAALLGLIVRRFRGPRDAAHPAQAKFDAAKAALRDAVAHLVYVWVERYPHMLAADEAFLMRALMGAFKQVVEKSAPARLKQAFELFEKQKLALSHVPPSRFGATVPLSEASFTALDVGAVCNEWSLIEYELFRQIAPSEFLRQAWNKADKQVRAPNMLRYIDWFNQMSRWVQTAVLAETTMAARAAVIGRCIEFGEKLLALNNFNALMEILSALNNSAVFRLKRSWCLLPAAMVARFEQLNERMSPSHNYKTYRAALARCRARGETYLAFLGVSHTDLTFADDANEDWIGERINIEKATLVGEAILVALDGLRQPYAFASDQRARNFLLSGACWDDHDIYRISMMREGRLSDKEKAELEASGRRATRMPELSAGSLGQQREVDTRSKLSEKDWSVLSALGAVESHAAGAVVINAGAVLLSWLRVRAGHVRVEVMIDDEWQLVRELGPGSLFGHAEALLSPMVSPETLFRCVATRQTELCVVRRAAVLPLMETDFELSQRFWLNIAQALAEQLRQLPFTRAAFLAQVAAGAAAASPAAASQRHVSKADLSLPKRRARGGDVGAELEEKSLAFYSCSILHRIDSKGTLYVQKNRLVMLSTVFGVVRTRKLGYEAIRGLRLDEGSGRVTVRTDDGDDTVLHKFKDGKAAAAMSMIEAVRVAHLGAGGGGGGDELARRNTSTNEEREALTEADWELLTKGAKRVKLARDEAVVREGDVYQCVYQIASGQCRVTARSGSVLATLHEGEVFGEVSFVQRSPTGASATVIADGGDVELIVLEGYYVYAASQEKPGFGGRFFRYLSTVLAQRIEKREAVLFEEEEIQ